MTKAELIKALQESEMPDDYKIDGMQFILYESDGKKNGAYLEVMSLSSLNKAIDFAMKQMVESND